MAIVIATFYFWIKKHNLKLENNRKSLIDGEYDKWVAIFTEEGFDIPILTFDKYEKVEYRKHMQKPYEVSKIRNFFFEKYSLLKYKKELINFFGEELGNKYYEQGHFDVGENHSKIYSFLSSLEEKSLCKIINSKKDILKTKVKHIIEYRLYNSKYIQLAFDDELLVKYENKKNPLY